VYAKLSGRELLDAVQKNGVKGLLALAKKNPRASDYSFVP